MEKQELVYCIDYGKWVASDLCYSEVCLLTGLLKNLEVDYTIYVKVSEEKKIEK